MSSVVIKKGFRAVLLAMGLVLFMLSMTLLNKPGANQGVAAAPRPYATAINSPTSQLAGITNTANSQAYNVSISEGAADPPINSGDAGTSNRLVANIYGQGQSAKNLLERDSMAATKIRMQR